MRASMKETQQHRILWQTYDFRRVLRRCHVKNYSTHKTWNARVDIQRMSFNTWIHRKPSAHEHLALCVPYAESHYCLKYPLGKAFESECRCHNAATADAVTTAALNAHTPKVMNNRAHIVVVTFSRQELNAQHHCPDAIFGNCHKPFAVAVFFCCLLYRLYASSESEKTQCTFPT